MIRVKRRQLVRWSNRVYKRKEGAGGHKSQGSAGFYAPFVCW